MRSGERSALEHNGMPLRVAQNAGRVRPQELAWLGAFSIKQMSVVDRTLGERFIDAPEPGDDEEEILQGFTSSEAKPKQNLNTGENFVAQQAFSSSEAPAAARTGDTAIPQKNEEGSPNRIAPRMYANPGSAENMEGTASSSTALERRYGATARSVSPEQDSAHSGAKSIDSARSGVGQVRSHVLVQKIVKDRVRSPFSFSSISSPVQREASDTSPSWTFTTHVMEMPMQYIDAPSPGEVDVSHPRYVDESPWQTGRDTAHAGLIVDPQTFSGSKPPSAAAENRPSATTGQQELLERLSLHEVSPKRVHIGNLHIKVQRPGAPTGAQVAAPQQNGPSQEATIAPQMFINPWDRHWTVFD